MPRRRPIYLFILLGFLSWGSAPAQTTVQDSLEHLLSRTRSTADRVEILLDLKDLCEDTPMNLVYSRLLFDAAVRVRDVNAASTAIVPIVVQYGQYPEKADSLPYYVEQLRRIVSGTQEEDLATYCDMLVDFKKFGASGLSRDAYIDLAHQILAKYQPQPDESTAQKISRLFLTGYANSYLNHYLGQTGNYAREIPLWEEAWRLALTLPLNACRSYLGAIYLYLSGGYNQKEDYPSLVRITREYTDILDRYYGSEQIAHRREYLYKDNTYVRCYSQLMKGALNIHDKEKAYAHYQDFRGRMLAAHGDHLRRNRLQLYEMGYLLMGNVGRLEEGIAYCDSLIGMIERGEAGSFPAIQRIYRDRAILLNNSGRHEEACAAFERAMDVNDSLLQAEYARRTDAIRRNRDVELLRLEETRMAVRNRHIALIFIFAVLVLCGAAGYYWHRNLKQTRRLRDEIFRQNRRVHSSEQMKSAFIDSICQEIRAPFNLVCRASQELTRSDATERERLAGRNDLRSNTSCLLSMLDSLLEAANLDSLADGLPLEPADILVVCREQTAHAADLDRDSELEYICQVPDEGCIVHTHPKYAAFVIRALLNNATKFTKKGSITVSCRTDQRLRTAQIAVTDTGCGIPEDKRDAIFTRFSKLDASTPGNGLSLSLCRLIANRLQGNIRLDTSYTAGARFVFSLPLAEPDLPTS